MKKLIIIISFAILGTIEGYTQNNKEEYNTKEVYILFESLTMDAERRVYLGRQEGIYYSTFKDNHIFDFIKRVNNKAVYTSYHIHNQRVNPDQTIEVKPESYLTELKNRNVLIDWDEFYKKSTEEQIRKFLTSLYNSKKIYFINRTDIKNDSIKIINAKSPLIY